MTKEVKEEINNEVIEEKQEPMTEEVIEEPVENIMEEPTEKTKKNGGSIALKIVKGILNAIVSVIYFGLLNTLIIVLILKGAFKDGLIEEAIEAGTKASEKSEKSGEIIGYVPSEQISLAEKNVLSETEKVETTIKHDEDGYDFDADEFESFFDDTIPGIIERNNIPKDVFNYIDEGEANTKILNKIAGQLIEYFYGFSSDLNIKSSDIEKLLNNGIDNYERATGETVDRSGVPTAAKEFTEELIKFMKSREIKDIRRIINSVFEGSIFYVLIGSLVVCGVILVLLNLEKFRFLRTLSIPNLIVGLTYFIIGKFAFPNIDVIAPVHSLSDNMSSVGLVVTISGVVGLVAYYVIKIMRKKSKGIYA